MDGPTYVNVLMIISWHDDKFGSYVDIGSAIGINRYW